MWPERQEGLRVAWCVQGGLGDALQSVPFIERFAERFEPARLAFYKDSERIETVGRIVVDCIGGQEGPFPEGDLDADIAAGMYDLRIDIRRIPKYTLINPQSLRMLHPSLWEQIQVAQKRFRPLTFVFDHHAFYDGLFGRLMADYELTVVDSMFYYGGFDDSRGRTPRIAVAPATREKVRRFALPPGGYVTVHDGFDVFNALAGTGKRPTRAWPREYWERLIAQLKEARPDLQIVQIGAAESSEYLRGIDHYLLGATSLEEAICVIDGAALHIDTEGGFVPCAWGLQTPAISIQGPTGSHFYHYDGVVQLFDNHCHGCWWSTPDWMEHCPRGLERAECMYRITPETVLGEALTLLALEHPASVSSPIKVWGETVWSPRRALPPLQIAAGQLDSVFWRGRRAAEERAVATVTPHVPVPPPTDAPVAAALLNKGQFARLMARDGDDFVIGAYHAILGREPDEGGLETYSSLLAAGDITKARILKALLTSDEARRIAVIPPKEQTDAAFATAVADLLRAPPGSSSVMLEYEAYGHELFLKAMSLKKDQASKRRFEAVLHDAASRERRRVAPDLTATGGLCVAVFVAGSLGDMLQQAPFVNTFSEQFRPATLDMYFYPHKQGPGAFSIQSIANARGPFDSEQLDAACQAGEYDLRIDMKHLVKYHLLAPERVEALSPRLYGIIAEAERRLRPYQFMLDQHPIFDGLFGRLMAKYGMNAVEATGFLGGLPMSRADTPRIESDGPSPEVLARFGLSAGRYIVLHDGFDVDHYMVGAGRRPTKNWPVPHWERLAQLLKAQRPDIDIAQIGHAASSEPLRGVDIDLIGKTSLADLISILEHAALVITSEGGILRIAWALEVPTVSLQGPSGSEFFQFGKVDTIVSTACNGCWFVLDEWMARCYRGYKSPICMNGIRPEDVAARALAVFARTDQNLDPT